MAYEIPGAYQIALEAAADLSAHQYRWVKLDGNGKLAAIAAATDRPCGILQDKPKQGMAGTVMLCGVSMLSADLAVSPAALAGTSADGQGVALTPGTDSTKYLLGQYIEGAGAANELATVMFDCRNVARAA